MALSEAITKIQYTLLENKEHLAPLVGCGGNVCDFLVSQPSVLAWDSSTGRRGNLLIIDGHEFDPDKFLFDPAGAFATSDLPVVPIIPEERVPLLKRAAMVLLSTHPKLMLEEGADAAMLLSEFARHLDFQATVVTGIGGRGTELYPHAILEVDGEEFDPGHFAQGLQIGKMRRVPRVLDADFGKDGRLVGPLKELTDALGFPAYMPEPELSLETLHLPRFDLTPSLGWRHDR